MPPAPATRTYRQLQGRHVTVAMRDGTRLVDCELVSAGRRGRGTLWLLVGDDDRIVAVADVADVTEVA